MCYLCDPAALIGSIPSAVHRACRRVGTQDLGFVPPPMRVTVSGRFPILVRGNHPLRTAIDAWRQNGESSPRAALENQSLLAAQRETSRELIAAQIAAGVDLPSDGYVPVYDEWFALAAAFDIPVGAPIRHLDTNTYYHRWILQHVPRRRFESQAVKLYRVAVSAADRPLKSCWFGPYTLWANAVRSGQGATSEAFDALVELWAEDVASIAAAGATWVQLDESLLLRSAHRGNVALVASAIRRIAAAAPGVTILLHLACGMVGDLLDPLLEMEGLGGIGLDFTDVHRAPNLAALKRWRGRKFLQAGIVDARQIRLESPAELAETLATINTHVPAEQTLVAPSTGLNYLPRHVAFDKLAALAALAHRQAS